MTTSQNSLSELIQNFIVLQNNAFLVMQKISESVTSDAESISFEVNDVNGTTIAYSLPSYKYMKSYIDRIDATLQTMLGLNETGESIVRNADGTYSRIYQAKVSKEPVKIDKVDVPASFNIKPNWFFENFLNPMLYISIDISKYVEQSADRIKTKRIILSTDTTTKIDAFNQIINGRNDITLNEVLSFAKTYGIDYVDDEDIKELPLSVLKYSGKFDVIDIKDVSTTSSRGVVGVQRKYYLNKLTYSDNSSNITDTLTLAIGNKFIVKNSIYEITSVDSAVNAVTLVVSSGYDSITIGADILELYSESFANKQADIAIGFNEREVVFFKSINDTSNLLSSEWSNGIAFYTNDLKIVTESGEKTLYEYYQKNVVDFGKILVGQTKENQISAIYGETPNTPVLSATNLTVVQINKHLYDAKELESIRKKGAEKIKLSSEINQLEKAIDEKKQLLGSKQYKTDAERKAVKNDLESLIREKTSKSSLYASIIAELNAISTDDPSTLDKPKFRIRGFFDIPRPVVNDETGEQHVVQFEYAYRYLSTSGAPAEAQQLSFNGTNSQVKSGTFTPWQFVKSDIRKKYFDVATNTYKWRNEDIQDPESANINQIDIPITKGEIVEIKVRSVSEAGWPYNPILSPWSTVVSIEFPTELLKNDESQTVLENAKSEDARVKFQQQLAAQGLDLHLETAIQTGQQYWAHSSDTISSGFYDAAGLIISLYEKLKQQDILIKQMQEQLNKVPGALTVKLLDETGNVINVNNGATISLFAGYYKEEIEKLTETQRKGAIITKKYILQLSNGGGSILEFISRFPGGVGESLPETRGATGSYETLSIDEYDYKFKRKYDMVPVVNTSVSTADIANGKKITSIDHQSGQLMSQFLYLRYKDIGLKNDLYIDPTIRYYKADVPTAENAYYPTGEGRQPWIWLGNEVTSASPNPQGNGVYRDFCVHVDCPILKFDYDSEWNVGDTITFSDYMKPKLSVDSQNVPIVPLKLCAFKHAVNFDATAETQTGTKQLSYKLTPITSSLLDVNKRLTDVGLYPDKLGFYDHDRYLVGKYTCGSYLFMGPTSFNQLLVDGTDYRAKLSMDNNESSAIQIPIYFQYRMVDYYGTTTTSGKVGGFVTNTPTNLSYEKRLGFDIYIQNSTPFSFDVSVNAKYTKTSSTDKTSQVPTSTYQVSGSSLNRATLGSI